MPKILEKKKQMKFPLLMPVQRTIDRVHVELIRDPNKVTIKATICQGSGRLHLQLIINSSLSTNILGLCVRQ